MPWQARTEIMGRPDFCCKVTVKKGHHILEVGGDLTFETIDRLRKCFRGIQEEKAQRVVLDCSAVSILSSVGLGEFSKMFKWGVEQQCVFKLVAYATHVVEVLEIAGLTDMIPLFPTVDMALEAK